MSFKSGQSSPGLGDATFPARKGDPTMFQNSIFSQHVFFLAGAISKMTALSAEECQKADVDQAV